MTENEAEKIVHDAWPKMLNLGGLQSGSAQNAYASPIGQSSYNVSMSPRVFVKLAVALGLLKLDEPKSAEMRAGEIINAYVDGSETAAILMELSDADLRIVEK